jgi:hypothetical protein
MLKLTASQLTPSQLFPELPSADYSMKYFDFSLRLYQETERAYFHPLRAYFQVYKLDGSVNQFQLPLGATAIGLFTPESVVAFMLCLDRQVDQNTVASTCPHLTNFICKYNVENRLNCKMNNMECHCQKRY